MFDTTTYKILDCFSVSPKTINNHLLTNDLWANTVAQLVLTSTSGFVVQNSEVLEPRSAREFLSGPTLYLVLYIFHPVNERKTLENKKIRNIITQIVYCDLSKRTTSRKRYESIMGLCVTRKLYLKRSNLLQIVFALQ